MLLVIAALVAPDTRVAVRPRVVNPGRRRPNLHPVGRIV
jgi:hypothetical protein